MDVTPQNQRYVLGRALNLIRFPLMPVEEFSIGVAQLGLLSETELVRLFLNFNISSAFIQHKPKMEFIDRPRCYMTGKQLSVYRFQQVETRWGYNGLSDQIRFTTDRRIYVVGFGLYGGLYGTKEYRVDIQISNTLTNTVLGHHSDSFLSDGSKSTFKIMFKEPIEILPDLLYTASATLRGPDSHYGAKGQRKVGVECPDGTTVNFTFSYSSDNNNGTSVEDGQIPELIFHT
jgi:BTB/POZ domain-containing protein 1/2